MPCIVPQDTTPNVSRQYQDISIISWLLFQGPSNFATPTPIRKLKEVIIIALVTG
jgi:hypothetical protein